ncbi:MAG: hypothetical protein M1272_04760 [Firmicutes bacterium]|nr:hypothetical protein [Bacillota bacterium]
MHLPDSDRIVLDPIDRELKRLDGLLARYRQLGLPNDMERVTFAQLVLSGIRQQIVRGLEASTAADEPSGRAYVNPKFPDLDLDHLEVGHRVRLWYTGNWHRVPLWLSMEWATIEDFTARGLLIVKPDIEDRLRRIRRDEDVREVSYDGFLHPNPTTVK